MKAFLRRIIISLCLMVGTNISYASDWTPLNYKIGSILDQVEYGNNLLLISFTGISYDTTTNNYDNYNYSIYSFDGINMTKVSEFYASFTNSPDMNIEVFENNIFIGGNFESINGDTSIHYIVNFGNNTFNKVGCGLSKIDNGGVYDFEVFGGVLLVAGRYRISNVDYQSTYKCDFLTQYSANGWEKFSSSEFSYWCYVTCVITDIQIMNSEIIVLGEFDEIDYATVQNCAKYSNGVWLSMDLNTNPWVSPDLGVNILNGNPWYIKSDDGGGTTYIPNLEMWNGSIWDSINIDYSDHYVTGAISFNNQLFIASQQYNDTTTFFNIGVIDINNGKVISDFGYYYNSPGDPFYPEKFFIYKSKLYATSYYSESDIPSLAVYYLSNSNTTSINTIDPKTNGFEIYPNPASQTISFDGIKGDIESMQVINLMGSVVLEFPQSHGQYLNIETLPNGKYLLKIQQGDNILTRLFVKKD